jgi:alpha-1,4-digalacturonate transport system permease protein
MSTQRSSLTQRAFRFTVTGPVPGTAPPAHRRVMTAGLAAAALSLAADVMLVAIGRAAFTVPASFGKFAFGTYLWNSVFITVVATLITLLINSMAAFALSKYRFTGQKTVFLLIIATLMVPPTIILVPAFLVISSVGLLNNLWGVILPAVATPTGVFLLRQYMLTIPDELIEAARMDNASEWRIYWKIILPLAAPAMAVLAIFSFMWRWNDFLWPLIVLSKSENFTLQLALNSFQGELNTQWHYLLAMTVITLIPITLVFTFLQKYIATGIASAGVK